MKKENPGEAEKLERLENLQKEFFEIIENFENEQIRNLVIKQRIRENFKK